jgi:rhodanese-related sulfurtransferase
MAGRMAAFLVVLALGAGWAGGAEKAPRMTKEQLKDLLGKPDVVVLDVRAPGDWAKAQTKVQGAVREDPNKAARTWAEKYGKDKTIVLYCA